MVLATESFKLSQASFAVGWIVAFKTLEGQRESMLDMKPIKGHPWYAFVAARRIRILSRLNQLKIC